MTEVYRNPSRKGRRNPYVEPQAECDICGFKYYLSEFRIYERNGEKTCKYCFDLDEKDED